MKKVFYPLIFILFSFSCIDKQKNTTTMEDAMTDSIEIKADEIIIDSLNVCTESDISDTINKTKFDLKFSFESYQVKVYTGKLVTQFVFDKELGADKEYVDFITEGCNKTAINFGGHYTILQNSCGCMCEHLFIIDRISGKVFTDIGLYESDGKFGYLYKADSNMLIANTGLFENEKVNADGSMNYYNDTWGDKPEVYVWKSDRFKRLQ
ncbi:hypothetical protein M2451_000958 [Dysgonomonas sp. PFB1-18]|uniref:hypothetical protein n=1 Tax=unclassified Dysgonomonas TaxID=2630389 RepID=UPI0024761216|nr:MULTISPECIES: hypothetical protein [unclassified Dysgonomonas]MDH6308647.1 hypothetical protein [Dysgonomonas sp. PF1-14]MDH6338148.1 hypothetical protein [Dysgonomonas sp. PF1-16]MDH6379645.1 hypothetical protein [Dysgonomonas sp. PFB1-18]MDH6396975.1 hypothetical protein [Dysgonomonas sp. PF1-23]